MSNNAPTPSQQVSSLLRSTMMGFVAAAIGFLVAGAGIYMAVTKRPPVVAMTDAGRIVPLVPLNKPYVTDSRVLAFAEECTRRAFAHDFVNYRATMASASQCFTSYGAQMYVGAMDAMLKELLERRMVMSASVESPVIVKGPYERQGRVAWRVQTKMQLFREGTKERITPQSFIVEMEVVRVELEESTRGISVGEFNVKPASSL
jgi:intracellular multiplication protein IcmL